MIAGIGVDLVDIRRIDAALQRHGQRFIHRILADEECPALAASSDPTRFLAKRFAAKEAFSKAFGTGIGASLRWHDVMVSHDENGKPGFYFGARLAQRMKACQALLSISDEQMQVIAFAVIENSTR